MTTTQNVPTDVSTERADLLQTLRQHRGFLLHTVRGLTDEQARLTPTPSALCLGGLVKHVGAAEQSWASFAATGSGALTGEDGEVDWPAQFRMGEDETLAEVVAAYERVAARTDEVVATVPDLDRAYPLPPAPWFPPGASWTVRRALLHVLAETSQHAGHADILREAIDGQKTMG